MRRAGETQWSREDRGGDEGMEGRPGGRGRSGKGGASRGGAMGGRRGGDGRQRPRGRWWAWRGYCVCGMAAVEEERAFEAVVEMRCSRAVGARTGLGGDGFHPVQSVGVGIVVECRAVVDALSLQVLRLGAGKVSPGHAELMNTHLEAGRWEHHLPSLSVSLLLLLLLVECLLIIGSWCDLISRLLSREQQCSRGLE